MKVGKRVGSCRDLGWFSDNIDPENSHAANVIVI